MKKGMGLYDWIWHLTLKEKIVYAIFCILIPVLSGIYILTSLAVKETKVINPKEIIIKNLGE